MREGNETERKTERLNIKT